jgi:ketosteroid isomerase-like protein
VSDKDIEMPNVEVAARWAESMRRGDLAEELWDPDLEIVNAEGWVIETTYRGHDGLRRWWNDLDEAFSELTLEFEEIKPLDDERVLTVQRLVGRFRSTGIPVDAQWASVVTVRAGRIARAVGYLTKKDALRTIERESGTI